MIVVTGAGGGIGRAVALKLASQGHPVCLNYRTSAQGAQDAAAKIVADGGHAVAIGADVGHEQEVERLLTEAVQALGPLRGIVNNAGDTGGKATVREVGADQLDSCYSATFRSVALMTKHAVRLLVPTGSTRAPDGSFVVNIASTAARTGGAGEWVHYAALKAAVVTYTEGAARELAPLGIRVNAVSPGLVESPLHERNGDPGRPERLRPSVPLGRIGTPEEVAAAVAFLASDDAGFVAGATLEVSGAR